MNVNAQVVIEPVPASIIVTHDHTPWAAPPGLQRDIDAHWEGLISIGATLARGAVLHVETVVSDADELRLHLSVSDYAHYMYTIADNYSLEGTIKVIYTAALLRTSDGFFVFGQISSGTATPGRLQCAGGGIDLSDFENGIADLGGNVADEVAEEIGVTEGQIAILRPAYLKSGGENGFYAVIFSCDVSIPLSDVIAAHRALAESLRAAGNESEFVKLVPVRIERRAIREFFARDMRSRVDYLEPLLFADLDNGLAG